MRRLSGWLARLFKLLAGCPPWFPEGLKKRLRPAAQRGVGRVIAISSGHGARIPGAVGILDEVREARRVVRRVAKHLREMGVAVHEFHDDHSTTVAGNIAAIVGWHNSLERDRDVSVHFNAVAGRTSSPIGTEVVVHGTADAATRRWASRVASAMATAGDLRLRRPGEFPGVLDLNVGFTRDIRGFVDGCGKGSVLLEVCFVNSEEDCRLYDENFDKICVAIAEALAA